MGVIVSTVDAAGGKVKDLDDKNFFDFVNNPEENVFVMFYSPECKHCQKLMPVFKKVAKIFKDDKDCVMARVNVDGPPVRKVMEDRNIPGVPTFFMFPKGDDKDKEYAGMYNGVGLVEYLNMQCGTN